MSDFFDMLEKYKFGLIAALAAYVMIFAYFQIGTYDELAVPYEPFPEGPRIEIPEDEIELKAENIKVPANFKPSDLKNTARDANDKRNRSNDDYSVSESSGALSAEEYEKKLFEEAGGTKTRAEIRQQMEEWKKQQEKQNANSTSTNSSKQSTSGHKNAAAGNVMVEFSVPNHTAHQGNDWYVRNPGYKCGEGADGTVIVQVKVSQSGDVITAQYDPTRSSGNITPCMIAEAEKYASISRFNYSAKAAKSQSGWISYTFVSQ